MKIEQERLQSVLGKVADKLLIKQWTFVKEEFGSKVKNYFKVLVPVKLIGYDNNREVQKPVFVKFSPDKEVPELKIIQQMFEVEVFIYCQLLPICKRHFNDDLQQIIPEYYYSDLESSHEVLVLKDMRSEAYKGYGSGNFLDSNHTRLSLELLSKFHALSIILKEKYSGFDNATMKTFYDDKSLSFYFDCMKNSIKSQMGLFKDTVYENYLMKLISDFDTYVISVSCDVKYLVYGHGDFQKDNILFKYENSKPIHACVLDFQKSRKMSPAQDFLLFLITNTECTNVLQHQQYINFYLDKLQSTLMKNDLENIYGEEDLKEDIKVVAPFCVASAVYSLLLWLGLCDLFGDVKINILNKSNDNSNKFINTVTDILNKLDNLKYIQL